MIFQETGRFGRITKNLRKKGFENQMDGILHDSTNFTKMNKDDQIQYIENVMERMVETIGQKNTNSVLFSCGEQCCGKPWVNFAREIWERSKSSIDEFIANLNIAEEKYSTYFSNDSKNMLITVARKKCICGLINKGKPFKSNKSYCNCSTGHMFQFFNSIIPVQNIELKKSIMNGDRNCEWSIKIYEL